jgi:hypothetical protein
MKKYIIPFSIFIISILGCSKANQTSNVPKTCPYNLTNLQGVWKLSNAFDLSMNSVIGTIDTCLLNQRFLIKNTGDFIKYDCNGDSIITILSLTNDTIQNFKTMSWFNCDASIVKDGCDLIIDNYRCDTFEITISSNRIYQFTR